MVESSKDDAAAKKPNWVLKAGGFLLLLIVVVMAKGIGREVGKSTVESYELGRQEGALEAGIQKAAAKIRPQLPVRVDEDTTMIGVVAAGKNIIYQMSVSTDIPEARIHEAQAEMQRTVALNVCQNEKTKALVEAGATMSYAYTLPSGRTFETDVNHC